MLTRFVNILLVCAVAALVTGPNPVTAQEQHTQSLPMQQNSESSNSDGGDVVENDSAKTIFDKFLTELHENKKWYQNQRDIYNIAWRYGNIFVIVATGLTAFLIAIDIAKNSTWRRIALAALPALAALTTSLTGQFRVQEMWELRESGRLDVIELINEVRLIRADSAEAMEKALSPIRAELIEIDREQSKRFFSYLSKTPQNEDNKGLK